MTLGVRGRGLVVAAAGALPFCLAQASADGPALLCPFRAATGLPCPLCGATRAFRLAGRGDPGFLRLNGWWVLLALVAVAGGLGVALTGRVRAVVPPGRALLVVLVVGLLAAPWAWALAARGTIAG